MPLRTKLAALLVAGLLLLTGCSDAAPGPDRTDSKSTESGAPGDPVVLRVIAGSEVKDLEPLLADMTAETGVTFDFEYRGTLEGTKALVDPANAGAWDLAWFPSDRYLSLLPEGPSVVESSTGIMRSPVVLGMKPSAADRLGWTEAAPPTWPEIAAAAEAGTLRYGMTNPASSNSGFTTLLQAATALSGTGGVLEPGDIDKVTPQLASFANGQALTSGSSGWLLDAFRNDPDSVDGVFNYESVLRGAEIGGEQMRVLVPSDGVITSDYPLLLLAGADGSVRSAYERATTWLLQESVQQRIADETGRRTTVTPREADTPVFELPFPAKLDTVNTLLTDWVAELKKPSNMVFAIDTSGSMAEHGREDQLREALAMLTGQERTTDAGFLALQPRERITLLEFGVGIKSEATIAVPSDAAGRDAALAAMQSAIDALSPTGDTAIYSTLQNALQRLPDDGGESISSIVVFTDGENTAGLTAEEFRTWYEGAVAADPRLGKVPCFVIVFGEADAAAMADLAELTGGSTFDARHDDLAAVFEDIRGYL